MHKDQAVTVVEPLSQTDSTSAKYSLSTRVFLSILILVTLSGVLIHIPSIASYHKTYLEHRIRDAYIATLVLQADTERRLEPDLEHKLLNQAEVIGIALDYAQAQARLIVGQTKPPDTIFDLRARTSYGLLWKSVVAPLSRGDGFLQIIGHPPGEQEPLMSVFIDQRLLYRELYTHTLHALGPSILISLSTAVLVYLSLQRLMVRPIKRITANLVKFRQAPESPESAIHPSGRNDEIGLMERELARMQTGLRAALAQQSRFAALGKAVSQINHDLKSILSTVSIASERLAGMNDPAVSKIATLLVGSVEKAIYLCTQTLDLARGEQPVLQRSRFQLHELVEEVGKALHLGRDGSVLWQNDVDEILKIEADRERMYRVLLNLAKNAFDALSGKGIIRISAVHNENGVFIEIADTGPGIPAKIRDHLFQPFINSARSGGLGLGLATAKDLVRAHGGDLKLVDTGPRGTVFRVSLPDCSIL